MQLKRPREKIAKYNISFLPVKDKFKYNFLVFKSFGHNFFDGAADPREFNSDSAIPLCLLDQDPP